MPLASKILFALSALSLLVTAVIIILKSFSYKKEVKAYKGVLEKLELEEAKRQRLAKEAEVIKRFNEMQKLKSETQDSIQAEQYQAESH